MIARFTGLRVDEPSQNFPQVGAYNQSLSLVSRD